MKFCPKCATKNDDGAVVCRNAACGHHFDATASTVGSKGGPEAMMATGRRYCNKCGTGNHMGATKCVRCGASIPAFRPEPPPIPKPAPRPTPPSPWWRLAEIVSAWSAPAKFAAVFAVCAALGIAVAASRDSSRRNHVSSAPRGTSGPPNNGHVAQGQMPQPSVSILGTAPGHTFDAIDSGQSAWWDISPGAGSAFAMFAQNGLLSGAQDRFFNFYWDFSRQMAEAGIRQTQADMRELDAEIKMDQIRQDQHDFTMAGIDGVSVEQFRAGESNGIMTDGWNVDTESAMGHDIYGTRYEIGQDGTVYEIGRNGKRYRK